MTLSSFIIGSSLVGIGFLTGLSGALIPGPMFAYVIVDTLKKGAWSGPLTILGHVSVEGLLIATLVVLGLEMKSYFSQFGSLIYVIGGVALIVMSFFVLRDAAKSRSRGTEIDYEMRGPKYMYNSSILAGVVLTVFNPSFIPWWMAIGYPLLLSGFEWLALTGILLVTLGHFLSDFAWYSFVSFSFSKGTFFFVGKRYQWTMVVIALFLISLGALFLVKGAAV
jgi:threonine/homoserine/homoserine lactone efflux protein